MEMRILVIGAGATGGYFGGRLAQAGRDVHFLVRPGHAERIRREGLRIISPHGDATIPAQVLSAGQIRGPFDLILLSVKAYSLPRAIGDLAPAVGPDTMILPVLNGMRHIELLSAKFGEKAVLGGVCMIASEIDEAHRIVQFTGLHKMVYGEPRGGRSPRIERLDRTMQGAGFSARASENIMQEMWEKWVLLACLGAANCLLGGNVGEIAAAEHGAETAAMILRECCAISRISGHPPSQAFLEEAEALMTAQGSATTSSMYRDMRRNGRVEVDQILGDLLARGKELGIASPLLQAAFVHLTIYQNRRSASAEA